MATHDIKQGSTLPKLIVQFLNASGDPLVIPDGAVCLFRARRRDSATYKINAAALLEDADTGLFSYTFETFDTDVAGLMVCEFILSYGATVQRIPTIGFDFVMVHTAL